MPPGRANRARQRAGDFSRSASSSPHTRRLQPNRARVWLAPASSPPRHRQIRRREAPTTPPQAGRPFSFTPPGPAAPPRLLPARPDVHPRPTADAPGLRPPAWPSLPSARQQDAPGLRPARIAGQVNLLTKFNERSGRNYPHQQLRNRWDACRSDYAIWKTLLQKASRIGRDPYTKTIAATDEWCALELKARPQATKYRHAPLAEEDKMEEVFDACCVTNEHARVPIPTYQGSTSRINLDDESGCEGDKTEVTPRANRAKGGKKRAFPYSPSPKANEKWASEQAKNEAFVRMVDLFDSRNKRDETQVSAREEIHEMMAMVEADGGAPGSDVHFYASQLFKD
ncbi:uncharacterized protein [Triticum aestivum]|uniref:uncharacterized protein n=1 Tax=Triticum aestivum TaxID=4565 RepID=UPI001D01CD69|nr:uncharacterized protein LOC123076672 [Triticum aestivum]